MLWRCDPCCNIRSIFSLQHQNLYIALNCLAFPRMLLFNFEYSDLNCYLEPIYYHIWRGLKRKIRLSYSIDKALLDINDKMIIRNIHVDAKLLTAKFLPTFLVVAALLWFVMIWCILRCKIQGWYHSKHVYISEVLITSLIIEVSWWNNFDLWIIFK